MSTSSSRLIAFISVYKPSPGLKPYLPRVILFHFASEWTISSVAPPIQGASKLTGRSTPLRLSLRPVSGRTNNGAEILCKLSAEIISC